MPKQTRRTIEVAGHTYHWTVGRNGVTVWDEAGKQHQAAMFDLTGLYPETVQDGQFEGSSDGMIRPAQVAAWIEAHLGVPG